MADIFGYQSPFSKIFYSDLTSEERCNICIGLSKEFRGEGMILDTQNIEGKALDPVNRKRLETMSCYINIYRRIIENESSAYAEKGFHRTFKGATKAERARLEEIYKELNSSLEFLQFEREAAFMGTVLVTITIDEKTGKFKFLKLTPDISSLQVTPNPYFPSEIKDISYERQIDKKTTIQYYWDSDLFTISQIKNKRKRNIETVEHKYSFPPFGILRYVYSSNEFWGPVDYSAYKFMQTRSLLLADAILRTQSSTFNIAVFTGGWEEKEVFKAMQRTTGGKAVVTPKPKSTPEGLTDPGMKFINPDMVESEKIWGLYESLYNHFLTSRGLTPRNFELSSDAQSAEAQRLSDQYMLQLRNTRREFLKQFEQQIFDLVVWKNNNYTNEIPIPDKITLIPNFFDPKAFRSISEQTDFYEMRLRNKLLTPPQILRQDDPDLSFKDAEDSYNENLKWYEEHEEVTEKDITEAKEEVEGEKDLGNPIEKGQDEKGLYVRYGKSGKKYRYHDEASFKTAKAKALAQMRGILVSGYKE